MLLEGVERISGCGCGERNARIVHHWSLREVFFCSMVAFELAFAASFENALIYFQCIMTQALIEAKTFVCLKLIASQIRKRDSIVVFSHSCIWEV